MMNDQPRPGRRSFLTGVCATALLPAPLRARSPLTFEAFAAQARRLTGFDTVPRSLLDGVRTHMAASQIEAFAQTPNNNAEATSAVLKAMYTGMYDPRKGGPVRFAYAQALMYAAVEDSLNVPSYCGGMPAYWTEKPANA